MQVVLIARYTNTTKRTLCSNKWNKVIKVEKKPKHFLVILKRGCSASPCGICRPDGLFYTKLLEQCLPKLRNNAVRHWQCSKRKQTNMNLQRCRHSTNRGHSICQCVCLWIIESVLFGWSSRQRPWRPHSTSLRTGCWQLGTLAPTRHSNSPITTPSHAPEQTTSSRFHCHFAATSTRS